MLDMRRLDLRSTAFHEAGHAVSAVLNCIPFSRVWILQRKDSDPPPQGVSLGQLTRTLPVNMPDVAGKLDRAKIEAVQAFTGPIAECLAYEGMAPDWQLNKDDSRTARSFIRFATIPFTISNGIANFTPADLSQNEAAVIRLLTECCQEAEKLVNEHRNTITRVAEALLARWKLTAEEVKGLCR